jgi:hypothetical protein
MTVKFGVLAFLLTLLAAAAASADQDATFKGPESASEKAFVRTIQAELMQRYPTSAAAVQAGYMRYTGVDESGAISYANTHWQSADPKHPSQLWYDRGGHLLGADYSVLLSTGKARPQRWGVNPGRWVEFDGHIHWVIKDASGKLTFDQWMPDAKVTAAGHNPEHPTAADLVAMHKAASVADVVTVFHFPSIWDLIVWVKPNPNGAFADKNPTVTASAAGAAANTI